MEQEKIDRYVDNLDVNIQADLLKKVLKIIFDESLKPSISNPDNYNDIDFIDNQIDEFSKQYGTHVDEEKEVKADLKRKYGDEWKMKNSLVIQRVSYGRKDTPINQREYKLIGGSPVGFISDWKQYAKENGFNNLIIGEKNGEIKEEEVI